MAVTQTGRPDSLAGEHRSAAGGAVQVKGFAEAGVRRRQHHRPAVADVADVADQRLVEDAMDGVAVVAGRAPDSGWAWFVAWGGTRFPTDCLYYL